MATDAPVLVRRGIGTRARARARARAYMRMQAAQQLLREELAGIAKESGDFDSEDYANAADKMRSKVTQQAVQKHVVPV